MFYRFFNFYYPPLSAPPFLSPQVPQFLKVAKLKLARILTSTQTRVAVVRWVVLLTQNYRSYGSYYSYYSLYDFQKRRQLIFDFRTKFLFFGIDIILSFYRC